MNNRLTKPERAKIGQSLVTMALPLPETKSDKFRRLANGRAKVAIQAIVRLGQLATPQYDHTDEQVTVLRRTIIAALDEATDRLRLRKQPRKPTADII